MGIMLDHEEHALLRDFERSLPGLETLNGRYLVDVANCGSYTLDGYRQDSECF